MTDPLLVVRGVRKAFEAELAPVRALRGLALDVGAGEFTAVMGPSGCGKSTLPLADEPTGALDDGGQEVLELFRRLHADGQTIVMVTHSADVAAGATRVVRLHDGRLESDTAELVG